LLRYFPHRKNADKRVYHVQKDTTFNDVAMSVPRIYAAIENQKDNHQYFVVEMEGIIAKKPIYILIDLGSNLSYVSPQFIEECALHRKKHLKAWLVQLAGTKIKVTEVIEACSFEMSGMHTQSTLNILTLGSHNVFIGMDRLDVHKERMNFHDKTLECEYNEGNMSVLQGIQNPI
jgi:hypothetical protein